MLSRITAGTAFALLLSNEAFAQASYGSSGTEKFSIIVAFVAAIGFAVLFTAMYFSEPPVARPWTPEEYDQDAARLRAAGRHAEAKADYEEKRARMKLKEEELCEVEEFLAQQRSKRNGNSKHEGK